MEKIIKKLDINLNSGELLIGLSGLFILSILIIPMPLWALDFLFMSLILFSMLVFFMSSMISQSMDFSSFPSVLLISSVMRLVIIVSATRSILINGSCGKIVESLGSFFLGNNVIIGIVIFTIILTVQYIVITGGTTRISEVTARFTLDAMPGKQMSIDADLNAGLINEEEARIRRKIVEDEADFYGAMDGASKFIRGDTIASIIIIIINLIGGTLMGVIKGVDVYSSFLKYSGISVGMGLIAQISSLLTSVSAGILVSRATSGSNLAYEITEQLFLKVNALWFLAAICGLLFLIPSTPKIILIIIACISAYSAIKKKKIEKRNIEEKEKNKDKKEEEKVNINIFEDDIMELELGYSIVYMISKGKNDLIDKIEKARISLSRELGVLFDPIHVKDNQLITANSYRIKILSSEVAKGIIEPFKLLAINSGSARPIDGRPENIKDPVFMMPSLWILKEEIELFERRGYTVVEPESVIVTHITEVMRKYAHELLTREIVSKMIENTKKKNKAVVDELIPNLLSIGDIHRALANLLRENIPIKNFTTILEAFADAAKTSKDPYFLSETARKYLARIITEKNLNSQNRLDILTFSPGLEQKLISNLKKNDSGFNITLSPNDVHKIIDRIADEAKKLLPQPVVIATSSAIRYPFRKIIEKVLPNISVISYEEINPDVEVKIAGEIYE